MFAALDAFQESGPIPMSFFKTVLQFWKFGPEPVRNEILGRMQGQKMGALFSGVGVGVGTSRSECGASQPAQGPEEGVFRVWGLGVRVCRARERL